MRVLSGGEASTTTSNHRVNHCTICSKMALHAGIAEFVLWHKEGITIYDTKEYNDLSYEYNG